MGSFLAKILEGGALDILVQELPLSGQKVMYDCRVKCCLCVECLVAAMHRSISSMIEHAHMEQCKK